MSEVEDVEPDATAVLDRVADGFFALDTDWTITYTNEKAQTLIGREDESLLGRNLWEAFPAAKGTQFQEAYERAMAEQEPVSFDAPFEPLDAHYEVRAYPSETGLSVYFRDVTDRLERERQLETHRDKLAALVDRTEVVQEINQQIASASTRQAVESTVCRTLTATDFYDVAWIATRTDDGLTVREGAGATADQRQRLYEAARSAGPAGNVGGALERESIHVTQNADPDAPGPRPSTLVEMGYRSSISIPLVHEEVVFGVLTITSTTDHAFGGTERDLLSSLADTIAYALAAVRDRERHQSMVTDVLDSSIDAGIVIVDADDQVVWTNDRAGAFFGFEPGAVIGQSRASFVESWLLPAVEDPTNVAVRRPPDCGEASGADEFHIVESQTCQERFLERRRTPIGTGLYAGGCVELFYDITSRKQSERALAESERFRRTLVDSLPGMVYQCRDDANWTMEFVSDGCRSLTGHDPSAFERGAVSWVADIVHEDDLSDLEADIERAIQRDETFETTYRIVRADGEVRWIWEKGQPVETTAGDVRLEGFITDITERRRQSRELERQHRLRTQILNASPVGILVVDDEIDETIANDRAREMLSSFGYTFDSDGISIENVELADDSVAVRDADGEPLSTELDPVERVLETGEPVSNETVGIGREASDIQWVSVNAAPLFDEEGVDGVVTVFEDVTEQFRRRESLERLNHLNAVIRRINQTLVRAPDRETIRETVCSQLAGTDQYDAAWYAEIDLANDELSITAASGLGTADVEPRSASDEETVASRAVRSGSVVVGSVESDAQRALLDGSSCHAETASIAAIPIEYANTNHGVLCVCSDGGTAFSEDVIEVFEELRKTIGHAINAQLRKEGLVGDTATRLEFRFRDFPDSDFQLSEESSDDDPQFTFEETIPRGDGTVLQYVTTEGLSRDSFERIVSRVSTVESIRELSSSGEAARYEIRQSNPPLVDTLSDHGGRVESISIEDGDFYIVADLPKSADVREVAKQVFEVYPDADLEAQRSVAHPDRSAPQFHETVLENLTDRQRTALEVAYFAGYFEWPRDTTGEGVADTLDVSQSTFSQHLRSGQRKTYELLFEDDTP